MPPALSHIAETALYVDDLDRAASFYTTLFDLPEIRRNDHLCALRVTPAQVLLLFRRGSSLQPAVLPGGVIPPHDGHGPLHVCFGIAADAVECWREHLVRHGIPLESRVRWPSGAESLYFRDPDNHAVELATPGAFD
ncbi:MAG TPA: VOC family protein [Verrucomicrobiales bacterium]|nr:VOC family protein [Verrucomicrobiales bacterium]